MKPLILLKWQRRVPDACSSAPRAEITRFTYRLPDTPVLIRADSKRMEQVLDNLIENARKNVREGGEIRLTISCFEKELSFSLFNQCAPIPEPELPKIWSKFYRGQNTAGSGSDWGWRL